MQKLLDRPRNHLSSLDGFRVCLSLSMIVSHVYFYQSSWVSTEGSDYQEWSHNPLRSLYNFGSFQIDGFLILSGYLLATNLILRQPKFQNTNTDFICVIMMIRNRILRLSSVVIIYLSVAYLLGDPNLNQWPRILFFIYNYTGSYPCTNTETAPHLWTNSLEFQCFLIGLLIFVLTNNRYRVVTFLLLFISSFLINHLVYEEAINSVALQDSKLHVAYYFSDQGRLWLSSQFGFQFITSKSCLDYSNSQGFYMKDFYIPVHTRFASFIVGFLIAFYLDYQKKNKEEYNITYKIVGWLLWIMSLSFLLLIILPNDDMVMDSWTQYIVTCYMRQIFAILFGFLILTTLVPSSHPWYSSVLTQIMSLRFFYPLAQLSYGTSVFYYRIMLSLIYYWMGGSSVISIVAISYLLANLLSLLEFVIVEDKISKSISLNKKHQ